MNAVANRPRAAKIKPPRIESPLESVISRISSARDLIGMAIAVAEQGSHLEIVLGGIQESLLPVALSSLHSDSVSKDDVEKAYQGLFFSLSVLNTAWVVAKGSVVESTLQQAFEILDRAHSDMDSTLVQHWPIPDQPPAENGSTGDAADFERGMAVALDLLRAEQASRGQDVTCYRRHRDGRPQFRFWREHIEKLVAEPALIEGFDAVMSASGEDGQFVEAQELARVAPNEYFPGEIGADGTVPNDAIDAAWKAVEPARIRTTTCDIELAAASATSVFRVACHEADRDAVWGLFKLVELANETATAAFRRAETFDIEALLEASSRYAQAIEICGRVCSARDSELLHAGLMLMEVAKERIDALTESMQSEAQT